MKIPIPTLALVLAGAAGAAAYDAPGGDFRIAFPSEPIVEAAGDAGAVYKVADGDTTYMVRRMPCTPQCAGQTNVERFYDEFQQSGLAALKGTLQGQGSVSSGGHGGREFVIHAESKRTGRPYEMTSRVFRVGGDVYVASATTPREPSARAPAARVLDSFVLLK